MINLNKNTVYYQKYLKYKKKYLLKKGGGKSKANTSLKPDYPKLDSISDIVSKSFMEKATNAKIPIIYLPTNNYLDTPPYQTFLSAKNKEIENETYMEYYTNSENFTKKFRTDMKDILKYLNKDYFVNVTLIVNHTSEKHAILLYFDKGRNRIELWDSNGYSHGDLTTDYLETVLGYIRFNVIDEEEIDVIVSNEANNNINHLDDGHCDALTLLYAVLRSESYERGQDIYTISWGKNNKGKKNMLLLNAYIQKKNICELTDLEGFNDLDFIATYFTPSDSKSGVKKSLTKKTIKKKSLTKKTIKKK
mgnify:CR=1 FL=1|tara:strand:- start:55 stop:972 length:918 start_codon:yes stop_codon:yes gene_type:complete